MESEMTCCERIKFAFSKLLMEFFGTFVFTLLFESQISSVILLGLWVLTIFLWKISASQMNPAVTLAFMLRHDNKKIHVSLGLLMIAAQCAGAYCGALYWTFVSWSAPAMAPVAKNETFQAIMQETFGTFIFVLFFKIVTDDRLKFSNENAINCFIIASAYVSSRAIVNGSTPKISTYGACLNPAVAVGITLNSVMTNAGETFKWFWLYWLMPLVGSVIAILFYRFVYMKTQLMVMNDAEHRDDDGNPVQEAAEGMVDAMSAEKTLDD